MILPIIELGTPLTESVASTGVAEPIPNWLTLPRRFVRRRATPPDAGTVIEIPLKATELAVCKRPETPDGAPLTVRRTSVIPAAVTRLVTFTLRNTARLNEITDPGAPPPVAEPLIVAPPPAVPLRRAIPAAITMGPVASVVSRSSRAKTHGRCRIR